MLFPYFELGASLFILLLGFQIWTTHYENRAARYFAVFALAAFFATMFEYSSRIAFTLEFAKNLDRLSATTWAFTFSIFTHFAFIFAKRKPWPLAAYYLPPFILSTLFLFSDIMYTRLEIWNIGIVSQPSWWYSLFMMQTIFFGGIGIVILFAYGRALPQKVERMQALIIAGGSLLPLTVGVLTDELLPMIYGRRLTPPTAIFDMAVMMAVIFWVMRRYSLFSISPALAANTIIETMPDSLIVTDMGGRVIFINDEAKMFFHASAEAIAGHDVATLFKEREKYYQLYEEIVNKGLCLERFAADLVDPRGEIIPALINACVLRQKLTGEALGLVFIVRDIRG